MRATPTPPPSSAISRDGVPEFEWLSLGGEMSARIRELDWASTRIGPVESWSPALRMMVQFLLANRFPLLLWWGPLPHTITFDDPEKKKRTAVG